MRAWLFDCLYRLGLDDWNIDAPQPDLVRLYAEGALRGRLLDVGCGSGENAIFLARQGLDVKGIDFVARAVSIARARAKIAGVSVDFEQADAFNVAHLGQFDAVLDYGLMHQFGVSAARRYVAAIRHALSPGGVFVVQCLARRQRLAPRPPGYTRRDLERIFEDGWAIEIRPARYQIRSGEELPAWLALARPSP